MARSLLIKLNMQADQP